MILILCSKWRHFNILLIIRFFSVWYVACSYLCLDNLSVGLAAPVVVPLGHKWPLVILLDCVSKKYWVLLPLICSDIFCFSWPYKSGPSIAPCFVWQLRCCTSSSSQFLIFLVIILYTVLKCTLHLALDGAFCGAAERGYKWENIIDFINDNLESWNESFCFGIMCSWSTISCNWLGIQ